MSQDEKVPAAEPMEEQITAAADQRPWDSALPGEVWVLTLELFGGPYDLGAVVSNEGGFLLKDALWSGRGITRHDRRIVAGRRIWAEED